MGLFNWLFGQKEIPNSSPNSIETLCKIKNAQIADQSSKTVFTAKTNLSTETLNLVHEKIKMSASKGESPRHCKAIDYIPDDFEWEEYNYWYEKFKKKGEWPEAWQAAAEYHDFITSGSIETFLPEDVLREYDKKTLFDFTEKHNFTGISKKDKKTDMLIKIKQSLSEQAKIELYNDLQTQLEAYMKAEKAYLFQATVLARGCEIDRLKDHADEDIIWKAYVDDDACPFCRKFKNKKYKYSEIKDSLEQIPSLIPPFHPGCMCILGPACD